MITRTPRLPYLLAAVALFATATCSSDGSGKSGPAPTTTVARERPFDLPVPTPTTVPRDRVTFRGTLSLDGAPFDAPYVGAVVRGGGLVTPCQVSLPPVQQGRYVITVYGDSESSGCGKPGAEVALWTFARGKTLYTNAFAPWPTRGRDGAFDGSVSTVTPAGAVPATAQFNGDAFTKEGARMAPGTRVEAYVGTTRCGVASTRRSTDYSGFILAIVGADAIPGCTGGAPVTFRVDGKPARETAANVQRAQGETLDLRVR